MEAKISHAIPKLWLAIPFAASPKWHPYYRTFTDGYLFLYK